MFRRVVTLLLFVTLVHSTMAAEDPVTPNVLVIIADDLGVDILDAYGLGSDRPKTPNIDALASAGVVFDNAWSSPLCSAARACIQTGRHSFRTGVGTTVAANSSNGYALSLSETIIPEMLDRGTDGVYRHAAIGKWHLGNLTVGGDLAPNQAGYSHFAGSMQNLTDYDSWDQVINGTRNTITTYPATAHVDEALQWVSTVNGPWFLHLAFNTPHKPYHAPPASLHSVDLSNAGPPSTDPRPYFKAMVEAMDTEIGRLLNGLGAARSNTTVIFLGDNGTSGDVILPPFNANHGKLTLYDGGVNVPLIVSGAEVSTPGQRSRSLAHVTDLLPTIADLTGVDMTGLPPEQQVDGRSLVPFLSGCPQQSPHTTLITEKFLPNGARNGLVPAPPANGCQPDLGYLGPGNVELSLCGGALNLAGRGVLTATGAVPFEWGFLVTSDTFNPTPMFGGTLTPVPWAALTLMVADADGQIQVPGIGSGPLLRDAVLYLQMLMHDPAQVQSFAISNTVRAHFLPISVKAIRNQRYKLILRIDEGQPDEFYDLWSDPFESQNLLAGKLNAVQTANHQFLYQELILTLSSNRGGVK